MQLYSIIKAASKRQPDKNQTVVHFTWARCQGKDMPDIVVHVVHVENLIILFLVSTNGQSPQEIWLTSDCPSNPNVYSIVWKILSNMGQDLVQFPTL